MMISSVILQDDTSWQAVYFCVLNFLFAHRQENVDFEMTCLSVPKWYSCGLFFGVFAFLSKINAYTDY